MDTSKYRIHTVAASSAGSAGGRYVDQLSVFDRQLLDRFSRYLEDHGWSSSNSRASARSGIAKALVEPTAKLSANQRSYWRHWERFLDGLEEAGQ